MRFRAIECKSRHILLSFCQVNTGHDCKKDTAVAGCFCIEDQSISTLRPFSVFRTRH